ncbi:MAG: hypothetical protein R2792_10335 [Saprospiraceae bacterium]
MASPIDPGSNGASPFISRYVHILSEELRIKPAPSFREAIYEVEYRILVEKPGKQIPLLFYAFDLKDDFQVWLDGNEIETSELPEEYFEEQDSSLADFQYLFDKNESKTVAIHWSQGEWEQCAYSDLRFFEMPLEVGEHRIRVRYRARSWVDRSDWVKRYTSRYSLSPAKHWKSFGELTVIVEENTAPGTLTCNLGAAHSGSLNGEARWKFDSLPGNSLELYYDPPISSWAKTCISIGPDGMAYSFGLLLFCLHLVAMLAYRKRQPQARVSWVALLGIFLAPFLFLLVRSLSYEWIDGVIGTEAGRWHGYSILYLFLYPIYLAAYAVVAIVIDFFMKKHFLNA